MTTLLMRLAGPMQSWGTRSRFDERDTGLEPSKSGVIGLVCAALGREREAALDDLACMRLGVRVDREGVLRYDFQTAQHVVRADLSGVQETVVSKRFFLADACFLVGLEGERGLLAEVQGALGRPTWPLYLGRKGHVPSEPPRLDDGLTEEPLARALAAYRFLGRGSPPESVRYALEGREGATRMDQPLGPFSERRFGARYVEYLTMPWGEVPDVPF